MSVIRPAPLATGTGVQAYRLGMDTVVDVSACTLPTVAQPLRLREFDTFCATAVRSVERIGVLSVRLRLLPRPDIAATAADLLVRETACCSFFTFNLSATAGELVLDISVPARHAAVLDALSARVTEVRA